MASGGIDIIKTVPRVATLIYQTHQLWQEFQGVPDGIVSLVDQLKALEPLFCEIETQFNQDNASAAFKNSLELSRKAHASLEVLVNDMIKQLQSGRSMKRKYAAVKIMTKKSVLDKLEQGLLRCLSLLQIAIQAYQMAVLVRLNPETIAQRVSSELHLHLQLQVQQQQLGPLPPKEPQNDQKKNQTQMTDRRLIGRPKGRAESYVWSKYGRFALAYTKATGAWEAQIQLPSWLSTSVYELISAPAIAGWTYSYRVYNIIPENSEIIAKIRNGDLVGVRELFCERKASPFDKSDDGNSLLHYATHSQQYEICQLLLSMGLRCFLDDRAGRLGSPIAGITRFVAEAARDRRLDNDTVSRRIAKLFDAYLEPDTLPAHRLLDYAQDFLPAATEINTFQDLFMQKYNFRPLSDRLEAVRFGVFHEWYMKSIEELLSSDRTVTKSDVSLSSREKLSLMHSAAVGFGSRYPEKLLTYPRPFPWWHVYNECWAEFVTKVASAAAPEDLSSIELVVPWDCHEVPAWRGTPLTSLIGGVLCYIMPVIPFTQWDTLFHRSLRHWLSLLQSAGVDLLQYGQRETKILHDPWNDTKGAFDSDAIEDSRRIPRQPMIESMGGPRARIHRVDRDWIEGDRYWTPVRIIDLQIGASPNDWRIIWTPEFEYMACQFWTLIEKEEAMMPGAWVD